MGYTSSNPSLVFPLVLFFFLFFVSGGQSGQGLVCSSTDDDEEGWRRSGCVVIWVERWMNLGSLHTSLVIFPRRRATNNCLRFAFVLAQESGRDSPTCVCAVVDIKLYSAGNYFRLAQHEARWTTPLKLMVIVHLISTKKRSVIHVRRGENQGKSFVFPTDIRIVPVRMKRRKMQFLSTAGKNSYTILAFCGKAKSQTHSGFENLPVLGRSSVTTMPPPPAPSQCHASGQPAISTGPHVLPLWATFIKLRGPAAPMEPWHASLKCQRREKGRRDISSHVFSLLSQGTAVVQGTQFGGKCFQTNTRK